MILDLRSPCKKEGCSSARGYITPKNGQDVVRCLECNTFQYNAPKTETGKEVRSSSTVHKLISAKLRSQVLERANQRCELCGIHASETDNRGLHVGHIFSVDDCLAAGLTDQQINVENNLIAQCVQCNLGLGKKSLDFRLALSILSNRQLEPHE